MKRKTRKPTPTPRRPRSSIEGNADAMRRSINGIAGGLMAAINTKIADNENETAGLIALYTKLAQIQKDTNDR